MKNKTLSIYTDGASRGNPGPAGIGVVIFDGRKKIKELYKYIGESTNNVAEYRALALGLEEAHALKAHEVIVNLDSELVVKQLTGEYRVKDSALKALFGKSVRLLSEFAHFEIRHVTREKNHAADKLANKAINLSSLFPV